MTTLYIIAESPDGPVKIGITKNLFGRVKSLQTGNPRPLSAVFRYELADEDAVHCERMLHLELDVRRMIGEWFNCTPAFMQDYMPDFFRSEGLDEMADSL